ncbi:hypothetical protein Acsp06_43790 [Actinomycetospora sp. NBRC 106375]|uniref:hypothetical protein n=1 Tax=Actinomycetospora sp. NBRC 106375 TaxID=3032207 RepID=UPI0024A4F84C|nr:hypothetical protein [Actinomycetospora sp. NBRC 106375]GLZ48194.1 hypothetical protein Acsp06_43790 [Actinomycetospora sp. NBRC 106375]
MEPQVFPDDASPLSVAAGGSSPFVGFEESVGIDRQMFLRLVVVNDVITTTDDPPPRILLRAGTGLPVAPTTFPVSAAITDAAGSVVASATRIDEGQGIHLVRVELDQLGSSWHVQIGNDGPFTRRYTWVVAATDDDARQPWIDVPPWVRFPDDDDLDGWVPAGGISDRIVEVANLGSADLVLEDEAGLTIGTYFQLRTAVPVVPANAGATITIRFRAPDPPVAIPDATYYAPRCNDRHKEQHRTEVVLSAATDPPETGPPAGSVLGGCSHLAHPWDDPCLAYIDEDSGICARPNCRHDRFFHLYWPSEE